MSDIFLYPVSALLSFWHNAFATLFAPAAAWTLAVVFLTFTVRALLVRPALSQLRAGRNVRKLAPQMQKVRDRYRDDRQRMAREIQKLHAEAGTSPFAGCLPALLQIPVFLSLYWVLRNSDAQWISEFAAGLAVPLMLLAGLATFFTIRMSLRRQESQALRFMQYVAPAGLLVSGLVFPLPIGVLVYFLANNVWTLGQQHILNSKLDREESGQPRRKT
ncbi:membrane protein insertase YidC [Actinophytocola sp.]|uniref:membrane protein insertase YidC n=1 Tax=Actinophytocola sp. TaxID=1872138 RepID=UPI002ED611A9